jgi:hypothetical protein
MQADGAATTSCHACSFSIIAGGWL